MSKVSRRKFLYAGVGVTAAAGIGYLARDYWSPTVSSPATTSPTSLATETATPKLLKAAFDYSPKYRYVLQDPSQTIEFKNLTQYSDDVKPACEWSVDGVISQNWDYSTKLPPGKHTVRLTVRDNNTSDWAGKDIEVDEYGPDYPERSLKSNKGIVYLTGFSNWNLPPPTTEATSEELRIIADEANISSIRFNGDSLDVMYYCAEESIRKGYKTIIVGPRAIDRTIEDKIKQITYFSERAEELRKKSPDSVKLEIGNELSLDTLGFIEGRSWSERLDNLIKGNVNPDWEKNLASFVNKLILTSRERFHGEILYASGNWEKFIIPWDKLDIIGINAYVTQWSSRDDVKNYLSQIYGYNRKKIYVTEYGCSSYKGAWKYGGAGSIATGTYDEDEQVKYADMFWDMINEVNAEKTKVNSCFYYVFRDYPNPNVSREFSIINSKTRMRKRIFHRIRTTKGL